MDVQQTKSPRSAMFSPEEGSSPFDGSTHRVRRANLQAALQHVYREKVTSRASISRDTGLTRATVSDLIAQLVRSGLVREIGPGTSSGGKPPTLLGLNAGGRAIVAIDLSRQPFRGALLDLTGGDGHGVVSRPDAVTGGAG